MKVFALIGFLACLSFSSARVATRDSTFNSTVEQIREVLARYDPASITDVSFNLLDKISASLKSASISGFSNFVFPTLSDDGENLNGVLKIAEVSANVDSLVLVIDSILNLGVSSLDASATGANIEVIATYSSSPLRLTSLSALLQLEAVAVSGTVELVGVSIDISVESDVVDTINNELVEAQSQVSEIIMDVVNWVLSIVDPA